MDITAILLQRLGRYIYVEKMLSAWCKTGGFIIHQCPDQAEIDGTNQKLLILALLSGSFVSSRLY